MWKNCCLSIQECTHAAHANAAGHRLTQSGQEGPQLQLPGRSRLLEHTLQQMLCLEPTARPSAAVLREFAMSQVLCQGTCGGDDDAHDDGCSTPGAQQLPNHRLVSHADAAGHADVPVSRHSFVSLLQPGVSALLYACMYICACCLLLQEPL